MRVKKPGAPFSFSTEGPLIDAINMGRVRRCPALKCLANVGGETAAREFSRITIRTGNGKRATHTDYFADRITGQLFHVTTGVCLSQWKSHLIGHPA